jgi:thioredoxin 2
MIYSPCEYCGALNRYREVSAGKRPVCGKCKATLPRHSDVLDVGAKGLETLIARSPIPVVVDFWAAWCGPCRFFAPVFEKVARDERGNAVFAKLDTERAPEAASAHRVQAIPTLAVFLRGEEIERRQGALPESAFRDLLRSVRARAFTA